MPTLAQQTGLRLKNVLSKDKNIQTANINSALRADLELLLGEYLDLKSLDVLIEPSENGFALTVFARARNIKNFGTL